MEFMDKIKPRVFFSMIAMVYRLPGKESADFFLSSLFI